MNLNLAIKGLRDELELIRRAIGSLERMVTARKSRETVDYSLSPNDPKNENDPAESAS